MKYSKILAVLFTGLITTVGCKEKLDLAPFTQIGSETAFQTAERCLLALNGVYDAAQSGVYDPLNGGGTSDRGYPFGAAAVEQEEMRGEDMVNAATFYAITYQATYTPNTPNNVNLWKELYALVNKCNISIDGFRGAGAAGVLTSAVASQYEAECRFLRAMAHHELLIHFAKPYAEGNGSALGVPYRDFAISSSSALEKVKTLPRETVDAVYTKILADLDFAESNLAVLLTGAAGESTYRATKAAAIALKMRVKLHKNDMPGVIAEGNKLIPATINPLSWTSVISPIGAWALTSTVDGPFLNNSSKESIFSIRNDAIDNPGTNAALARMFGPNAGGARGLVSVSPIIWNIPEWTCTDKRRALLYTDGPINGTSANNAKFTTKYKDITTMSDFTPYIRYAEVLLMQSEAEARKNAAVSQRAIDLLNTVRNRALADIADTYTAASFPTKNALIGAILKERRIELLAEGKRWGDIHRMALDPVFGSNGIPDKMANGYSNLGGYVCAGAVPATGLAAIPYSDYRFLWPIPQAERTINPIIEQNPGY